MRGALAAAKQHLDLGESIPFDVLDRRVRARLVDREAELTTAMRPATDDEIMRLWRTFVDMRGGCKPSSLDEAYSIAKLRERDLIDVPLWAVAEGAAAFRRGEIGAGSIKPPAGPIRKEAVARAAVFFAELALIRRVLAAEIAPPPDAEMRARTRRLWQRLQSIAAEHAKHSRAANARQRKDTLSSRGDR